MWMDQLYFIIRAAPQGVSLSGQFGLVRPTRSGGANSPDSISDYNSWFSQCS